ncbi:hypothetical protein GOP47_0016986 [Adiantum capillus-veneris]|uniref:Uncharacterized protein n=1 Tax=Adiantum capillus-veneris TaxID=13818 RepID=A0A9D4UJN8_ADICA|nr:hypothetical protein GOP47_0016986 [Adiantum capillus-veneris]
MAAGKVVTMWLSLCRTPSVTGHRGKEGRGSGHMWGGGQLVEQGQPRRVPSVVGRSAEVLRKQEAALLCRGGPEVGVACRDGTWKCKGTGLGDADKGAVHIHRAAQARYCHAVKNRSMSGNPAAAGIEKGFWFVSTPQLDDEELSWQFGSSTSFSYSQYVVVDRHPGLCLNGEGRKTKVCGRSANAELGWDLLAREGSAVLSCPEQRVDYYSNACRDKAFEGGASLKSQDVKNLGSSTKSVNSQSKRYGSPCPAQNAQPPEVDLQDLPHKLARGSLQRRQVSFVNLEGPAEQPEKLGEALCHSQTRARNAEKLAIDVLVEKENLSKLLFREANTCRTYKERAQLLELENTWLKTHRDEHATEVVPAYCDVSELSAHCKFYQKGMSKGGCSSLLGTVGLAFALGLSCASAGFMIGCCMGMFGFSQ